MVRDLEVGWSDGDSGACRVRHIEFSGRGEEFELGNKLYVGNLPFNTTEADLRELFEQHGALASVNVIVDRETGRSRGFGFVEYDDSSSAEKAQRALDGQDFGGRSLRVNEANERARGGGGGGGRRF